MTETAYTNYASKTHTYRGFTIRPCEMSDWREHGGRWAIQTYHHTGISWADRECPHYPTLAAARESIDWDIAEQAQYTGIVPEIVIVPGCAKPIRIERPR